MAKGKRNAKSPMLNGDASPRDSPAREITSTGAGTAAPSSATSAGPPATSAPTPSPAARSGPATSSTTVSTGGITPESTTSLFSMGRTKFPSASTDPMAPALVSVFNQMAQHAGNDPNVVDELMGRLMAEWTIARSEHTWILSNGGKDSPHENSSSCKEEKLPIPVTVLLGKIRTLAENGEAASITKLLHELQVAAPDAARFQSGPEATTGAPVQDVNNDCAEVRPAATTGAEGDAADVVPLPHVDASEPRAATAMEASAPSGGQEGSTELSSPTRSAAKANRPGKPARLAQEARMAAPSYATIAGGSGGTTETLLQPQLSVESENDNLGSILAGLTDQEKANLCQLALNNPTLSRGSEDVPDREPDNYSRAKFCDVRKARIKSVDVGMEGNNVVTFHDEHGQPYHFRRFADGDLRAVASQPGVGLVAPALWELHQQELRRPVRPDYLLALVRLHSTSGKLITTGFAYPVRSPWNTPQVLDLLKPGSKDFSQELSNAIIRAGLDHGERLVPDDPTWATTVLSYSSMYPTAVALDAALAYPHLVTLEKIKECHQRVPFSRESSAHLLHVTIDTWLAMDNGMSPDEYRAAYVPRLSGAPLFARLMGNGTRATRINTTRSLTPAIMWGHSHPEPRLDVLQRVYDRVRWHAALGPDCGASASRTRHASPDTD